MQTLEAATCYVQHGSAGKPPPHRRACLNTLFERVSRGDWCKAGLCSHGECVAFRKPARALTRAGPSGGGEKEDGWPREPDPSSLAEAHLDNKCAGGHDDHGDISFGLSLRRA